MKKYFLHKESINFKINYEKELNEEQYAVVMHQGGPMLVLAGAGTGKTRTLTYRVARLIETGIRPANILLLTFTNKAANEMMRRVESLVGRNIEGLWGGTFHHIGNLILRKHSRLIGYREGYSIIDREDSKDLFDICLTEIKKGENLLPKGSVLCEIYSLKKNKRVNIEEVIYSRFPHFKNNIDEIKEIFILYERKKQKLNLMDFDDLLTNWQRLFLEYSNVREYYSTKFLHILVDEYQDTNKLQAEIIDLLSYKNKNLMVVGDDAQSIYSFRGASFENILKFPERYPDAIIFNLIINYRSTPEILNLANNSIINNIRQFHKQLNSTKKSGDLPYLVPVKDIFQQAIFVSQKIIDIYSEGIPLNEIAVLYRSHYQSMELQMELQRRAIPFEVRSGLKFFEQAHIKDILSFLRVLVNPYDELSWKRVFKLIPGIGNITAAKLWDSMYKSKKPYDTVFRLENIVPRKALDGFGLFLDLLKKLKGDYENLQIKPIFAIEMILRNGYEDYLYTHYPNADERMQDIEQMKRFSIRYNSLENLISDLSLQSASGGEVEEREDDKEHVILSTVHQAKGLEWNTVFIICLNDGRFPSNRSLDSEQEEEERRLFYVAVTRAKNNLFLCFPITAEEWHGVDFLKPSRFIRELPSHVYEEIVVVDKLKEDMDIDDLY